MAEPEWDEDTRNIVLGLAYIDRCRVCGRPTAECQAVETSDDWVADDAVRCHATSAVLLKQNEYTEEKNSPVAALSFPVHLRREA